MIKRISVAGLTGFLLALLAACGPLPPPRTTPQRPARPAHAAVVAPGTLPGLTIELCWNNEQITLPPPVDAQQKVYNTLEYRRWQYSGTTSQTTCLDAAGFKYVVGTVGKAQQAKAAKATQAKANGLGTKKKKKGGKEGADPAGTLLDATRLVVSRYRPDGTLDNVTTFRSDSSLDNWLTYAPNGTTRQVRVQMRNLPDPVSGAPLIQSVDFFEPDRIRRIQVNARNIGWQELVVGETGVIRSRLHEDPSKADKLMQLNLGIK